MSSDITQGEEPIICVIPVPKMHNLIKKKQTQIEGTQQTTCTLQKCQYNTKTKELSQI